MRRPTAICFLLTLVTMFTGSRAGATSLSKIASIRIESRWAGLGEPRVSTYLVARSGNHYVRGSKRIPDALVEQFSAAIASEAMDRSTAIRSFATPEWLAAHPSDSLNDASSPRCSPEARSLLSKYVRDPDEASLTLESYFTSRWTDDFPSMYVQVQFQDGSSIQLESTSQLALMLPWKVGEVKTWNPGISRTLADLLPRHSETRLSDGRLAADYVELVARRNRGEIDTLEERCIHRRFIASVEKLFEIVRIYHGSPGTFTAYVRRPEFPENLLFTLVIHDAEKPDARKRLDLAYQRSSDYVDLARSYVASRPNTDFAIWSSDGVSVEGNDRAVKISEYDVRTGIVRNPRVILPDGSLMQE
jgi:hypothetical protein